MNKFMNAKISDLIDVESLLPNFEALEACLRENSVRIGKLSRSSNYKARLLAEKLLDCDEEEPCYSLACHECVRRLRLRKISQLVRFSEDYTEWNIATFIYFDEMVRELEHLNIKRLKGRLSKQLERAGVKDVFIGYFEVDYQTAYRHWMPHFHLLVRCKDAYSPEWMRLRSLFQKQDVPSNVNIRKHSPVVVQKLEDPLAQIAYICKFMWHRAESYVDTKGRRKTKKYRLSNSQFVESLLKLNSLKLVDLEFMDGMRQYGTTLKESVRGNR
ncbi:hypothetical protein [Aeromonas caviae]|uniref:hypothetical protein n=1 Tax=Aeromonas caviae TaxID=648 RepID=UPI002B4700BF|nr:hypothetical protein [Aeromonas caviae]